MSEALRTLLVAIDLEHGPDAALRGAIAWARDIGARLIIGNVIDRVPSGLSGIEGMAMEVDPLEIGHMAHDATRESLEEHIAEHDLSGIDYELHVRMGSVVDELVRLADDVDADVIIVGRSSAGAIERVVLGSTAERLMRHAGRIVALVPEGDWHRPSRLVFATDFGVELDPERTHVFLCGNPAMIGLPEEVDGETRFPEVAGVVELLTARGFTLDHRKQRGNIHFEEYW